MSTMGTVMTSVFTSRTYSKDPEDFYFQGLNYWPGKATPYRKWERLLPNYTPPPKPKGGIINNAYQSVKAKVFKSRQGKREMNSHEVSATELTNFGQNHDTNKSSSLHNFDPEVKEKLLEDSKVKSKSCNTLSTPSPQEGGTLPPVNSHETIQFEDDSDWKNRQYPFENLVLSGGGMKGYAYIGAIKALEEAGVMPQMKRFAGASAGAMCSAALSVGYTAQEICKCFFVDLEEALNDQTCACICCVPKLYTRYGVHPLRKFFDGFGLVIAARAGGNIDLTFKQLYEQFDKELCIVVCNITQMTTEYCHHTTTPDLAIRHAVRMSMAIPLVYEPATRVINGQTNYYIDGSTGDHFPIHVFDGPTVGPNFKQPANPKTLGCYVLCEKDAEHVMWINTFGKEIPSKPLYMPDTKLARGQLSNEIKRRKKAEKNFSEKTFMRQLEMFSRHSLDAMGIKHYEAPNKTHVSTNNVLEYMMVNLELFINAQVACKMRPEDEHRTVPINVGYIESHMYDLEPPDREFMLKQGYTSCQTFLQHYGSEE